MNQIGVNRSNRIDGPSFAHVNVLTCSRRGKRSSRARVGVTHLARQDWMTQNVHGVHNPYGTWREATDQFRKIVVLERGRNHVFENLPVNTTAYDRIIRDKHPFKRDDPMNGGWGEVRLPDGQIVKQ